ncbi:MAG TPA: hypothetical protein DGT23_29560 [Micromonosporaceae bacterium]|nr:hypothetical protein [Micromonosporaceae bacterium]
MLQGHVREVMTIDVITCPQEASLTEIAAILAVHGVSAVPVVDSFDTVVGVVSWADLHHKIGINEAGTGTRSGWLRRSAWSPLQWPEGTAAQVMSAPAVTIGPDASLPAAARVMYRRKVSRLLVVDEAGRLRGIVTRSDLLKVHARLDDVIRDEVMQRILRRTLKVDPGQVQATVDDGVLTLTGHTRHRSTAVIAVRLCEAVAGITDIIDQIASDVDDILAAAPRTHQPDDGTLGDWWPTRRPGRRTAANRAPEAGGPSHRSDTRSAVRSAKLS